MAKRDQSMRLLNVRAPQSLHDLIDTAYEVSDSPSKSEWCREALEAGAHREIEAARRAAASHDDAARSGDLSPSRRAGKQSTSNLGGQVQGGSCVHPPTARYQTVTMVTCLACGATLRRLV